MPAITTNTRLDLPESLREEMTVLLNQTLVTTIDLYTQVKQAHWVVKGPQFIALHELFDASATELLAQIDDVAERITALSGLPQGTAKQVAAESPLADMPQTITDGLALVKLLADRYAIYAQQVRNASDTAADQGDASTADLFTGLSRAVDKRLWLLESHLN